MVESNVEVEKGWHNSARGREKVGDGGMKGLEYLASRLETKMKGLSCRVSRREG